MVVERGQRMATPGMHGEVALEVHLPELVRALPLKARPSSRMLGRSSLGEAAMAAHDLGDRARRRDVRLPAILERSLDLPPAPGIVAQLADLEHLRLDRSRCAGRTGPRPPRPLLQTSQALSLAPMQPLVASRRTYAEAPAQLPNVRPLSRRKRHELSLPVHRRHPSKRHPTLPITDRKSVHDVSEHASMMSPVYTPHKGGEGKGESRTIQSETV